MKFLGRFALWSIVLFVPAWYATGPYQRVVAAIAARLVTPPGTEIELVDIQLYYPFDLAILLALCLASDWATWRRRFVAAGLGAIGVVAFEIGALAMSFASSMVASRTRQSHDELSRFLSALIRLSLVPAVAAWFFTLGRERFGFPALENTARKRDRVS